MMKTPVLRLAIAAALVLSANAGSADEHRGPSGHSDGRDGGGVARFRDHDNDRDNDGDHDRFHGDRDFHDRDRFHDHFGVFIGPPWNDDPFYWDDYPYQPPVYYSPPQPPVYVQQNQQPYYWYWCPDPPGYYPYVQSCPQPWQPVVPYGTPPR